MSNQNRHSKFVFMGPGGKTCACCFPAPGSKERIKAMRIAKRIAAREARNEINKELQNE